MIRLLLLVALLVLPAVPVRAALTQAELSAVALSPPPGARLPPDLPLVDETGRAVTPAQALAGRPAVLIFADYTCITLCGTALTMAAGSLARTGLQPGRDYVLLVVGINPRDGPDQAAAMKAAQIDSGPLGSASIFLTGDPGSLAAAQAALGYAARWDAENKQYAHPLGALVLTPEGRVSRVLGGLDLDPDTLRFGLVEASSGRIGTLAERLRLLCYGFDPAHGVYLALSKRVLTFGTAATMLALAGFVLVLTRRRVQ
jgi:protein SCO1/2